MIGEFERRGLSDTAKLFQRLSHMLDPRVGRGMFNTFHAEHLLARYPLDHVFHTREFTLKQLRRLGYTGSDHFPILVGLAFTPSRKEQVIRAAPTIEDLANAEEMVEDPVEASSMNHVACVRRLALLELGVGIWGMLHAVPPKMVVKVICDQAEPLLPWDTF